MKLVRSAILVLLLSSIAASGQTLTPVANPTVLDHNGKFMGHVLGYTASSFVYLLFNLNTNEHVVLPLHAVPGSGLAWWQGPFLLYQSFDCTGQAYSADPGVGERYAMIGPNNVLYLSAPGASPQQSININSIKYPDHPCQGGNAGQWDNLVPVNPTVSLDTLFQGPFRVTDVAQESVPAISPLVLAMLAASLAAAGLIAMKR